jgi:hypothetical protein
MKKATLFDYGEAEKQMNRKTVTLLSGGLE